MLSSPQGHKRKTADHEKMVGKDMNMLESNNPELSADELQTKVDSEVEMHKKKKERHFVIKTKKSASLFNSLRKQDKGKQ